MSPTAGQKTRRLQCVGDYSTTSHRQYTPASAVVKRLDIKVCSELRWARRFAGLRGYEANRGDHKGGRDRQADDGDDCGPAQTGHMPRTLSSPTPIPRHVAEGERTCSESGLHSYAGV